MSNEQLNQNLIKDCDVIWKECIPRYYQKKKWRWSARKEAKSNEKPCGDIYRAPPTIKKWVIDLSDYNVSEEEENPIDLSEISDDESYNEDIPVYSNSDSEWINDKLRWTYFVHRLLDCKNEVSNPTQVALTEEKTEINYSIHGWLYRKRENLDKLFCTLSYR